MLSLFLGGLTSTAKCATARLYNGSWFAGGNGRANQDKTYYPTAWWTSNSTKAIIYYTCTLDAGDRRNARATLVPEIHRPTTCRLDVDTQFL